jgi:hypothetical protein
MGNSKLAHVIFPSMAKYLAVSSGITMVSMVAENICFPDKLFMFKQLI